MENKYTTQEIQAGKSLLNELLESMKKDKATPMTPPASPKSVKASGVSWWQVLAVTVVLASVQSGLYWWHMPPATPLVDSVAVVTIDKTRTQASKDGKGVDDGQLAAAVGLIEYGNGTWIVSSYPVGLDVIHKQIVISDVVIKTPVINVNPAPVDVVKPMDTPPVVVPQKPTLVIYFYEKDQNGVPPYVQSALNKINRLGINATIYEKDSTDGLNRVPPEYKPSLEEALKKGLPVLVVMAGDKVITAIKSPSTEAQILEAAK